MMIRGGDERSCQMIKENGLIIDIPPLQDHVFLSHSIQRKDEFEMKKERLERRKAKAARKLQGILKQDFRFSF
jgi:hypothetical protein